MTHQVRYVVLAALILVTALSLCGCFKHHRHRRLQITRSSTAARSPNRGGPRDMLSFGRSLGGTSTESRSAGISLVWNA